MTGFAFRDQHLNEVILESLRANPNAVMHGLLFGALGGYTEAKALAPSHANFRIHAENGAIVGAKEFGWTEKDVKPTVRLPVADVPDANNLTVAGIAVEFESRDIQTGRAIIPSMSFDSPGASFR
jgi:hypothetical protein